MERGAVVQAAAIAGAVIGLVMVLIGARAVARARAAARWPGQGRPALGRPLAGTVTVAGLVLVATGAALLAGSGVEITGPHWRRWAFQATVGVVALAIGGYAVTRLVDRAELTALIRTPHVPGQPGRGDRRVVSTLDDPAVPFDGQAGWVYRDQDGGWYLAVAATGADQPPTGGAVPGGNGGGTGVTGHRLVRLSDFTLAPVGAARGPLDLAGSVEVRVLRPDDPDDGPADEPDPADEGAWPPAYRPR